MTLSDKRLRQHKQAAAGLAIGTSTLGVAALGSKGVAVGSRRALKAKSTGLRKVPGGRLERVSAGADRAATNLTVTGAGLGGIGGYNFAAIQAAEAKRRPVNKNYGGVMGMDFGLSNVHQHLPVEISKAGTTTSLTGSLKPAGPVKPTPVNAQVRPRPATTPVVPTKPAVKGGTLSAYRSNPSVSKRMPLRMSAEILTGAAKAPGRHVRPRPPSFEPTNPRTTEYRARRRLTTGAKATIGGAAGAGGGAVVYSNRRRNVSKAYDPERKRSRRLEGYQAGLNVGAGALGAGAVASGRGNAKAIRRMSRQHLIVGQEAAGALRKTGRTGALGLGAVGAAFAADRVGRYRKGRGRSYNALRG